MPRLRARQCAGVPDTPLPAHNIRKAGDNLQVPQLRGKAQGVVAMSVEALRQEAKRIRRIVIVGVITFLALYLLIVYTVIRWCP